MQRSLSRRLQCWAGIEASTRQVRQGARKQRSDRVQESPVGPGKKNYHLGCGTRRRSAGFEWGQRGAQRGARLSTWARGDPSKRPPTHRPSLSLRTAAPRQRKGAGPQWAGKRATFRKGKTTVVNFSSRPRSDISARDGRQSAGR